MPQDINLPLGEEILYTSESNMKPEFIDETYYIYYTNQQLSNNFNDEVLILTDKIKHEHFYNESSDRFEEYRSFENIDDALETMYQILNKKKWVWKKLIKKAFRDYQFFAETLNRQG